MESSDIITIYPDLRDHPYYYDLNFLFPNETFKFIEGFEKLYEISNYGRIKRLYIECSTEIYFKKIDKRCVKRYYCQEKILRTSICKGYLHLSLTKNKKWYSFYIHRLVLNSFYKKSSLTVNHKDLNRLNNHISNLEYLSVRENSSHYRINNTFKSKFVGVNFDKALKKWKVTFNLNGKSNHLGYFTDEADAGKAYLQKCKELNISNRFALKAFNDEMDLLGKSENKFYF